MATQYLSPAGMLLQQLSNLGVPLAGGFVNVLVAGSVSTPQTSYTDSTGLVPNAQPIVLNSAGRLAAGNAPVSIWVPANTPHKITVTDSAGNLLSGGASLDNLFGINDPTALNSGLANPATGFGVDLVANALKSYDVFSSVRAANVPALAAGQTLIIDVEGGASVGDGLGGEFYWSASSVAADDGSTVIKPTAGGASGRYLRLVIPQTALQNVSGSFTAATTDVTGGTSSATIFYTKVGQLVTLVCPTAFSGTSASTAFTLTGMPALLFPARQQQQNGIIGACQDNTVGCGAIFNIAITGVITASKVTPATLATGVWTASGTKSLGTFNLSYALG